MFEPSVKRVAYRLRVPAAEAVRRVAEAADRPTFRYWAVPGSTSGKRIVGSGGSEFWWRRRHDDKATFAPWLSGRIESAQQGAVADLVIHSPITTKVRAVVAAITVVLAAMWLLLVVPNGNVMVDVAGLFGVALPVAFVELGTRALAHEQVELESEFAALFADEQVDRQPTHS